MLTSDLSEAFTDSDCVVESFAPPALDYVVFHMGGDVSGKHDEGDFFVGHGENIARGRSLGKSFRQCGEEPAAPCAILPL